MHLAAAFTKAWQDVKAFGSKAESWIAKQSKPVEAITQTVGAVIATVDPALTPMVSTFDALEEVVIGKIAALAHDTATATSVQNLVGDAWPTIQGLVSLLKQHPAVVNATVVNATQAAASNVSGIAANTNAQNISTL